VILERLQDRETPVPIDPAAVETPDAEVRAEQEATEPSAPEPRRRRRRSTEVSRA